MRSQSYSSLVVASMVVCTAAFQTSVVSVRRHSPLSSTIDGVDRSEAVAKLERAAELSDFLAQAYEDKVKAIETVEKQNQAEIDALKAQIESLQSQSSGAASKPSAPPKITGDLAKLSNDDLKKKLQEYEEFMAKTMADADPSIKAAIQKKQAEAAQQQQQQQQQSSTTTTATAGATTSGTGGVLGTEDLLSVGAVSALTAVATSVILDNTRRQSFGSIVAGVSAPLVAGNSAPEPTETPAPAPATVAPPAPVVVDLSQFETTMAKVQQAFPGAATNDQLVAKTKSALSRFGFGSNSLVATSFCSDEVNRPLETDFAKEFKDTFSLGGLAGFPFSGVTGFGAMAKHIPDGGSCLVVYGPHVGVDLDGNVGTVNRRGREKGGTCCGSAVAAAGYISKVFNGEADPAPAVPESSMDAQQLYVGNMLLPYAERIGNAQDAMVELPYATYEPLDDLMQKIVAKGCGKVSGDGKIALLGGLQINTPAGCPDYFLPLRFEVRDNQNNVLDNLLYEKRALF
jgi:hypothetical protein